jgi:Vitamin K-dependent gamma-carboxylase
MTGWAFAKARIERWLPQPAWRLELIRVLAPLAILGFMSGRMLHADEWLGSAGFRVPDLDGGDWRQPLHVAALPDWACWAVAIALGASCLAVTVGLYARPAALACACLLAFVALADRLAAFTVSKLSPTVMLALALSPCGRQFAVSRWLGRRGAGQPAPTPGPTAAVRFFQILLPLIYSASGIAKLRGDWSSSPYVLWTLVHDSYQTPFSWALANALPPFAWTVLQVATLCLEVGAPLWFALRPTRPLAFYAAITMHLLIGLMFGPVKWFALLMISLLMGSYLPEVHVQRLRAAVAGVRS